ncbi:putative transcriptional regulator [Frankia canadensis]|uniref:Putative transcriptional regulator n=1 Tax=Frankia canadensis TaxID=1836972 RepID=A0A2I2L120_9ACTN|nr:transcriptional regulator [Frankia canadensis]SNQ51623.1 putative transcriptional regulator [Frankia canadensis]SOU58913.1 putative transcriptional regulator [Frankia canadensis]
MPTTVRSRSTTAEQERAATLRARHPGWDPQRLRDARDALGWSRATLTRKIRTIRSIDVPFTPPIANEQTIRRHERGWAFPGEDWQAAYTHTMGLNRVDLGFCTREANGAVTITHRDLLSGPPATDDEWVRKLWATHGLSDAWEEVTSIDRREFTALTGLTLLDAAREWLVADPARIAATLSGRRADAAVIADLTTTMDALRRLDDKLGGQAVNGMILEQLRLVVRVLRNASYTQSDGQALHGIAAELARMAGWTAQDSGDHTTAQRLYLTGLRAAHDADNPGIAANILRCMAAQACDLDDAPTAVELLRSARAGTRGRLTPTENAVIAGQLAVAHGQAGNRDATRAAADEAHTYIDHARPDGAPPYVYWASAHTIAYYTGTAMISAGSPDAAVSYLQPATDNIAHDMPRDLVFFRSKLAVAHARAGAPETALTIAHQTIDDAAPFSSARTHDYIAEACREIRATRHPGADDLTEHARTIIGAPSP